MSFLLLAQVHGKFSLPQISDGERVKAKHPLSYFSKEGIQEIQMCVKNNL